MERRKFLIGAGSLAAGSAAALGTGAFTSVSANRDITVSVADDPNAYLALDAPEDSQYASDSGEGKTLSLTFDKLNWDGTTTIYPIFEITNNGTQPVAIQISNGPKIEDVHLHWFVGKTGGKTLSDYDPSELLGSDGSLDETDSRVLGVGDTMPVGMYISTGSEDREAEGPNNPFSKGGSITISALSSQELKPVAPLE